MTTRINQGVANQAATLQSFGQSFGQFDGVTQTLSKNLRSVNSEFSALSSGVADGNFSANTLNELQGLAHKQQLIMQAFQLISNVLAAMRQTMGRIIQNIR